MCRPAAGGTEIAVVHRPRYDDWSLPKGKLEVDEHPLAAAAREVQEETGLFPQVGRWLTTTSYLKDGTPKTVDYWAMRPVGGSFRPGDEVDDLRWVTPAEAAVLLTNDADRGVLDSLREAPSDTTTILLVRHAQAGAAQTWTGDDALRPLDTVGRKQAADLVPLLTVFRPARVLSADLVRCTETVRPVASHLGVTVEPEPLLSESTHAEDPQRLSDWLVDLAHAGKAAVACSQGGVIPDMVLLMAERDKVKLPSFAAGKGSIWALSFAAGGRLVAADYYSRN